MIYFKLYLSKNSNILNYLKIRGYKKLSKVFYSQVIKMYNNLFGIINSFATTTNFSYYNIK